MNLDAKIEAILFHKAEPLAIAKIAEILGETKDAIIAGAEELENKLSGRGLALLRKDDSLMLGTTTEASAIIEKITKEELAKDLGKAALETLAIIIYEGPIARASIDHIRGVNSSFILRNLLIRGLIERIASDQDGRAFLYRPTFELLQNLGINRLEDMPEYGEVQTKITNFIQDNSPDQNAENNN